MPDIGTAVGAGSSLLGGLFGGGDEEVSKRSNESFNKSGWQKSLGTKTYNYMPSLTDDEKLAMWTRSAGRINNSWLSGNKNTANAMASRGLGGGALASGFSGNNRARNEALSGAATDIEIEGAKKLIQSMIDASESQGTSSGTSSGYATGTEGSSSPFGDWLIANSDNFGNFIKKFF